MLCKILYLHVLIFCSFMNKAFTAKAVVVCDVKLHRAAENSFGFRF